MASEINTGARSTQFSDRLTLAATSVVFDSPSGVRLGGTVIARYDHAGNSAGLSASWTAATAVTESNPAGVWDFAAGFGRPLAAM